MAVKAAINGFGRIGRLVYRALVEQGMVGQDIEVVAVGDIVPADNLAYLLSPLDVAPDGAWRNWR